MQNLSLWSPAPAQQLEGVDDENDDDDDDDDDDDNDDDDDYDVIMTSFTDILKTCIPIHLCLKCIMGLRYAWLPPAHCFNKTNTSILTLL